MASEVDIVNGALGQIANSAEVTSISPVDGSPEADHAARFYPIARDECLERYTWSFNTVRSYLSPYSDNPMINVWGFAYGKPNKILHPIAVLAPGAANDTEGRSFLYETLPDGSGVIYTNVEGAILKYLYRQEDPTKFTPLFVTALMTNLASYFAGPLAKDIKLRAQLKQQAQAELAVAAARDSAQKVDYYKYYTPGHLAARS